MLADGDTFSLTLFIRLTPNNYFMVSGLRTHGRQDGLTENGILILQKFYLVLQFKCVCIHDRSPNRLLDTVCEGGLCAQPLFSLLPLSDNL